jgi:hypothetical protein
MTVFKRRFNHRRFITPMALGVMLSAIGAFAQTTNSQNPGVYVYPPGSKPYGLSYGEWSARWWQWVLSIPPEANPILDGIQGKPSHGNHCAQGQSDPVWLLPGTIGGTAFRTCTVPLGRSLLFPILNSEFGAGVGDCQTPGGNPGALGNPGPCAAYTLPPTTGTLTGIPALQAAAAAQLISYTGSLEVTIDDVPLRNLTSYRAQSPVFSYWLTSDSLFNDLAGFKNPASLESPIVSDGYWVMFTPLHAGTHTLHFRAASPPNSFVLDVTYLLFVVPDLTE